MAQLKFTYDRKQSYFILSVYLYKSVIDAIALLKNNEESPDSIECRTGE